MRRLGLLLCWSILNQSGLAVEQDRVIRQLHENFAYIVASQVECNADFLAGRYICNKHSPGERRIAGTWDSYIIPRAGRNPFPLRYLDSNLYVTVQTLLPLFSVSFQDPVLEQQRLDAIYAAMMAVNVFRRDDGFAFWPQIGPTRTGYVNRIGPLNLSPLILATQLEIISRTENFLHVSLLPKKVRWMEEHVDLDNTETGVDVLFNVPNDADDTALGITSNFYYQSESRNARPVVDTDTMSRTFSDYVDTAEGRSARRYKRYLPECRARVDAEQPASGRHALFRDREFLLDCSLDDEREHWRYDAYDSMHSGAFLTWLFDETDPIYGDPESGVVLPGQNSVDCNALANVVHSLSLTGMRDDPILREGYVNSCNAISNTVITEHNKRNVSLSPRSIDEGMTPVWNYCGLFFPAHMTYPYLVSRAVGDGGACQDLESADQERFDLAMQTLLEDLAQEQDAVSEDKAQGQWYEKTDRSVALPTALGGVSMLNLSAAYGERLGMTDAELRSRIEDAVAHTIALSVPEYRERGQQATSLPESTYFGGGTIEEIAHWRSQPFSTAVSLELMSKFLLAYSDLPADGSKLILPTDLDMPERLPVERRTLSAVYVQDSLDPVTESGFGFTPDLRLKSGDRGDELIAGASFSIGEHFSGRQQEKFEEIAYYAVKMFAGAGLQFDSGRIENYRFEARFAGVSTDTDFILQDDVGHFPLSFTVQDDVATRSVHWRFGQAAAPLLRLGDQTRLNIRLTGSIVGYVRRSYHRGVSDNERKSYNLADLDLTIKLLRGRFSAAVSYATGLGYSEDSEQNHYVSLKNYRLGATLEFAFDRRHAISVHAVRQHDGGRRDLFDDDQIFALYRYTWPTLH